MRLFVMVLTLFVAGGMSAQSQWNDYSVKDNQVLYQGQTVDGADAQSFTELGFGYGKDSHNVYLRGEVLEFVDPESFRVDARFTRRHSISTAPKPPLNKTLPVEKHPKEAVVETSDKAMGTKGIEQMLGLGTAETGSYEVKDGVVTYEGAQVKKADAATFEILGAGYARDKRRAYYKGNVISTATGGKHFSYQGDDYATDGIHTYFKGKEVDRD